MDSRRRRQLQFTSHLMMVRPLNFGFNEQTAESNAFQQKDSSLSASEVRRQAVAEFDSFVEILRNAGITVTVFEDIAVPHTPDAVFPNNWISFHSEGKICVYPMLAPNRQAEVRQDMIAKMSEIYSSAEVIDFRSYAKPGQCLEGTGSMILDRAGKVVYACISPRTDISLLEKFCEIMGYQSVVFTATDENGQEIYHTNVLMGLGDGFAVICMDAISDKTEREHVSEALSAGGFEIVNLSHDQMNHFAGNLLQVINGDGVGYAVVSQRAYDALDVSQITQIQKYSEILVIPLDVIETFGGGSVRCMMAEVFPQLK